MSRPGLAGLTQTSVFAWVLPHSDGNISVPMLLRLFLFYDSTPTFLNDTVNNVFVRELFHEGVCGGGSLG